MMVELMQAAQDAVSTPHPDATVLAPYLYSASALVLVQKWMKGRTVYTKFVEVFPGADKWAHLTFAFIGAIIGAAGIHYTWNYHIDTGGDFSGHVPGLVDLFWNILHGSTDVAKVSVLQQILYEATHQPPYTMKGHQ